MKKALILICGLLCLSSITSCNKEKNSSPAVKDPTKRTVLTYMFQDTNLWDDMIRNINDMELGWDPASNGTMLVYVDPSTSVTQFDGKPVLLEIQHDTTNLIVSKVVKTYADTDATNTDTFLQVQKDAIEMYPAESYGLIISGHGDGFFVSRPKEESKGLSGSSRWGNKNLEVDVIAANVATHYDFIILDACLMGETTSLYQLRNATDFVVAAVELFSSYGFGFRTDIKALYTQPKADLFTFGSGTIGYYNSSVQGREYIKEAGYLALGVYRMSAMEKLAAVTKKSLSLIMIDYEDLQEDIRNIIGTKGVENSMYYPQLLGLANVYYYDMGLLPILLENKGEDDLAGQLRSALAAVVIQKHITFANSFLEKNNEYMNLAANISFYIPSVSPLSKYQDKAFYNRFGWSEASGFTAKWEESVN